MSALLSYVTAVGIAGKGTAKLPSRSALKRGAVGIALLAGLGLAGNGGYDYWKVGQYRQTTDDAYVRADYTTIAPKVSGYIVEVAVADNQKVAAGQLLARIDDRDFRVALDQANADVATADAALRNLDAQIAQQRSVIDQVRADIAAVEATLAFAQADHVRYGDLVKTGYGTVQRAQQAETAYREKTAQAAKSRAGLAAAERKIDVLESERAKAQAERQHMLAVRHQAELNLGYATIAAPVDGTVGARSLRVGQYVQAGTPLMAVVPLGQAYVVANFKETQLGAMRAGQPAEVTVDSFAGVTLRGHVDSLAPASGQEFALLPPDNATGNFTKIVQRVPVKIVLDDGRLVELLRSGMSVEATVDTKQAR